MLLREQRGTALLLLHAIAHVSTRAPDPLPCILVPPSQEDQPSASVAASAAERLFVRCLVTVQEGEEEEGRRVRASAPATAAGLQEQQEHMRTQADAGTGFRVRMTESERKVCQRSTSDHNMVTPVVMRRRGESTARQASHRTETSKKQEQVEEMLDKAQPKQLNDQLNHALSLKHTAISLCQAN